jgi:hypothetical protein
MREESLLCQIKKRFVITTTNSRHGFPIYPNVLADVTLSAPDQAWVADFTYIRPERVRLCTWPAFWMPSLAAVWAGICHEK